MPRYKTTFRPIPSLTIRTDSFTTIKNEFGLGRIRVKLNK